MLLAGRIEKVISIMAKLYVFVFSEMHGVKKKYAALVDDFQSHGIDVEVNSYASKKFNIQRLMHFFRPLFMSWIEEKVIVRHTFFDPFLMFFLFFRWITGRKTFLEHHSDHVAELRNRGFFGVFASIIEKYSCNLIGSLIHGHICVSLAVLNSQKKIFSRSENFNVIENGVSFTPKDLRSNYKEKKEVGLKKIIFVASEFCHWHGLEKILYTYSQEKPLIQLVVVGKCAENIKNKYPMVIFEGRILDSKKLNNLVCGSDICIDSLNLSSLGLTISSSIKAKEYIALGKPILGEFVSDSEWEKYTFLYDDSFSFRKLAEWYANINLREIENASNVIYEKRLAPSTVAKRYNDVLNPK